ncbi:ribbon-helix-helix protein, CopG family [Acidithiobacillus sp. CV18-2]|uniref:Ribbon-helix-helix protein, CopG family n=1 Tax=Igneacidithiobacillus copahuensis TaxID=2724909 RepID=A0AAE3CJZ1_9PROT|nr:ribbon-helix-helix protein, CopG family [Igneacidithiobacillus copahuensis]MBU2754828.1 ribbon-helix-helix protein, CopG family [Acidithiobacillus sp. CV18-3]MBU2756085.1 ribbon-helix-helix protein, CopG family [Acidithiobacillus sp. BN09-2]MBU2775941.1 ribbon-helix-helix protein, CopG family [Acidithiobacillus sp. CV18-2]MBU2796833.1 ribbon-helix-helix protein, CopG family [Acidithiobacillus sp. VAN18-2]MBU2800084.1 ribbon-helix-helix protein, CopG family [Acidithiobacillus sp. VAN18-4]UT
MATASERIPVLVTPQEKALISKMAQDAHMSMGELLRRAASSFRPNEEEEILEGMIGQILKTSAQANAAIDEALAFVEDSERRIAAMESGRTR